jgi:D-amino-acid dehydrogenase
MKADCIVLGAGMVGLSAAIHLLQRGRSVVLIDRRGAAEETSYGNTGIIQTEAVLPYTFPRELKKLMKYSVNGTAESHWHYSAAAHLAPNLFQYWRHSTPERIEKSSQAFRPLAALCLAEHEALARDAGVANMLRRTGYMKLYRSQADLDRGLAVDERSRDAFGIKFKALDAAGVREIEPHIEGPIMGGIFMPEPVSVGDPGRLGKAYAGLFTKLGGQLQTGDARTLARTADGWSIGNVDGPIEARDVVIALGPWSDDLLAAQGVRIPMFVKRGYHMHFKPRGNATLARPILDVAGGYCLTPMTKGIRLTTGAEFTWRDAEPTPVQLRKVEPMAREILPLADRVDPEPWMGRRPCLPDMVPMIGPVVGKKGLWADFGHQHWGFTLGPVTGRLLAELVTGGPTFTDPFPYRTDRFA